MVPRTRTFVLEHRTGIDDPGNTFGLISDLVSVGWTPGTPVLLPAEDHKSPTRLLFRLTPANDPTVVTASESH